MPIRCKFKLTSVTPQDYGNAKIHMEASYDNSIPEDQQFSKYTPTGHLEALINNPHALEQLVTGQDYYIDITPVPK
jgi:hypothetical protein